MESWLFDDLPAVVFNLRLSFILAAQISFVKTLNRVKLWAFLLGVMDGAFDCYAR